MVSSKRRLTDNHLNPKNIFIVMGVYNGEKFLGEQIASILAQDHTQWQLLVRDDGSQDGSLRLLEEFTKQEARISLLRDKKGNIGVIKNFGVLAKAAFNAGCKYLLFADQDDVWHPQKLSKQLAQIKAAERDHPGLPLLGHSDLEVVDSDLSPMNPSLMRFQGIRHCPEKGLNHLLIQNFVTGCTMILNRALLKTALPLPQTILMHDWWFALCAAATGRILYLDTPLVKYRQHDTNQVGAKSLYKTFIRFELPRWIQLWRQGRTHLAHSLGQADALLKHMENKGQPLSNKKMLQAYSSLMDHSPVTRLKILAQHGIKPQSFCRTCLAASRVVLLPSDN